MYTPQQHQHIIKKLERTHQQLLIHILFELLRIEEEIESPQTRKKIEELKKRIGKELKD